MDALVQCDAFLRLVRVRKETQQTASRESGHQNILLILYLFAEPVSHLFQCYFLSPGCILCVNKSEFARSANAAALGAVNMPEVNAIVIQYIGPNYFLGK